MAKKRKAGRNSSAKEPSPQKTRYTADETFNDSQDEFEAGKDQILLEEAPDAKRRRKLAEKGQSSILNFIHS